MAKTLLCEVLLAATRPLGLDWVGPNPEMRDMDHTVVGTIRRIGFSDRLALVIFERAATASQPEDVRVVPLAPAGGNIVTERDVRIPASLCSLRADFIAEAWNSRSLVSLALGPVVGQVQSRVVDAVRIAELVGIVPGLDTAAYADLIGHAPDAPETEAIAAAFQRAELRAWNEVESQYRAFERALAESVTWTFEHGDLRPDRSVFAHRYESLTNRAGESIVLGLSDVLMTYPDVSNPGALGLTVREEAHASYSVDESALAEAA